MPSEFLHSTEMAQIIENVIEDQARQDGMTKLELIKALADDWNNQIHQDIDDGH